MAQISTLTPAQVLLLATQLATESDLNRLEVLAAERKDVLDIPTIHRLLLTFLPFDSESQSALAAFLHHATEQFSGANTLHDNVDTSAVDGIPDSEIDLRVKELRFSKIASEQGNNANDSLVDFVLQWVRHTEAATGLTNAQLHIIEAFSNNSLELQNWNNGYVLPLWRLQNEFYPGQADSISLDTFESLHGQSGVQVLLQFAEALGGKADIGRDLTEVVSPWVLGSSTTKRRKMSHALPKNNLVVWDDVFGWIYSTTDTQFDLALKAVKDWAGPPTLTERQMPIKQTAADDNKLRYAQTIMAIIFRSPEPDGSKDYDLSGLLQKAIEIASERPLARTERGRLSDEPHEYLSPNKLLSASNTITHPSDESFELLSNCIFIQKTLSSLRFPLPIIAIADITLFGSEERQKQELNRILAQIHRMTRLESDWLQLHTQLLQLCSPIDTTSALTSNYHFLGRLTREYVEKQILDAIISSGKYQNVVEIYLDSSEPPLDRLMVKNQIVSAIFDAYDHSTNGNRTRGGMKKASDLLQTFRSSFPNERIFHEIGVLLKATHSLSFYSLTLQHGTPLKPVNIRNYHDPISLIEKLLDQNSKAYTQIEDLLEIGRGLVEAGLTDDQSADVPMTREEKISDSKHRVTYLAITAALSDHDFDTAYSYITTRLSIDPQQASSTSFNDDTSWRAAYAAGKYRPPTTAQSVHEQITGLSKRMDLLSLALTLAPNPEPLSEILATWRRSEEEMDSLRAQALEEERSLGLKNTYSDSSALPGGFVPETRDLDIAETKRMHDHRVNAGFSPTYEEEAPMGLFDVARGAASAFRNSAFPLGRAVKQQDTFTIKQQNATGSNNSSASFDTDGDTQTSNQQATRRKRDVVSGMVTGGLVSGMSWVLGAQPVNDKEASGSNGNDM